MQDSGGADTWGCEMLITDAVAMLFSCSDWDKLAAPCPLFLWTSHLGVGYGKSTLDVWIAEIRSLRSPELALRGTTGLSEKFLIPGSCDYNLAIIKLDAVSYTICQAKVPDWEPRVEMWLQYVLSASAFQTLRATSLQSNSDLKLLQI